MCELRSQWLRATSAVTCRQVWRGGGGCRAGQETCGGELVPPVFESGERPALEMVAYVCSLAADVEDDERSRVIRYAWQQFSDVLQSGNAEMILSATG